MSREEILGLNIWGKELYRRGWKEGIHYFWDGYFPPRSKAEIICKREDWLVNWKYWKKGEEIKKRKVNWRNVGIGTTRRLGSKPSTTKFRLLEEWISRCIKWTGIPARMDESMERKPRTSMGACCGGAPHHLATMATHPRHTKERCPTRHLEHNFWPPSTGTTNENHGCLCNKKYGRYRRHPEAHNPTRRWNRGNCISNGTSRPGATGII